ncbi:MAG TPA: radical SAM protein [Bryobacteraceae bacterium]|nr:radical SAM protein [Bryobacteraceae bacterium]
MPFEIFESEARSILSPVSGFLFEAGFTHSLNPARNCTFGCTYCYVPTMRTQAGLQPADWNHWGQFTTFKGNAAELLRRSLRAHQVIYCSPLTDPYQPAEAERSLMRGILEAVGSRPPAVFVIQTRGPLILRDLDLLRSVARQTRLRVSFSITTNREDIRRIFEPHCAPIEERWATLAALRSAGIDVFATLAPLLPCDPEALVERAVEATAGPVITDPFHVRAVKRSGATTRQAAIAICDRYGWMDWLDPEFQRSVLERMRGAAAGREVAHGPYGFGLLAKALF